MARGEVVRFGYLGTAREPFDVGPIDDFETPEWVLEPFGLRRKGTGRSICAWFMGTIAAVEEPGKPIKFRGWVDTPEEVRAWLYEGVLPDGHG